MGAQIATRTALNLRYSELSLAGGTGAMRGSPDPLARLFRSEPVPLS